MPRHSPSCCACQHEFEVGETFVAFLYTAAGGFERRDFCTACRPADEAALAQWRTRRPAPRKRGAPAFDREAVFTFFTRLDDAETPEKLQFRFVLALLLWRKKVLRFTETIRDAEGEIWRFETPAGAQRYDVRRPDLDDAQIERLSAQLEQLLAGGAGDAPAAPSAGRTEPSHA
jgi:hypothetical protein